MNIEPSDVVFHQKIHQGGYSAIFQVITRGNECVMKVVSAVRNPQSTDA